LIAGDGATSPSLAVGEPQQAFTIIRNFSPHRSITVNPRFLWKKKGAKRRPPLQTQQGTKLFRCRCSDRGLAVCLGEISSLRPDHVSRLDPLAKPPP